MKILLILFVEILLSVSTKAQVKTLYFNGNTLIRDSTIASAYGVFGKVNEGWVLKRFNLQDELLNTGMYKDELMNVKHGEFVYYNSVYNFNYQNYTSFDLKDQTRFVTQKAKFENNLPTGTWIWYYPNGKILTITNYFDGKKNGEYATFDKDGNGIQKGNFVMDEKDGLWYYDRGRKKETYKMGVLQAEESPSKNKKRSGTIN